MSRVEELWVARDRAIPDLHLYPQMPLDSGPSFSCPDYWPLSKEMFPEIKPGQRCRVDLTLIGEPEEVLGPK